MYDVVLFSSVQQSDLIMHIHIMWRRKWQPTPGFWPPESHGQKRSLVGYSPWGRQESGMTGSLAQHIHLLHISISSSPNSLLV